ncbi:MAG: RIP metalloprotease RseP [Solitalea-like symbiont of Tyrophagus putrescentiae]
MGVLTMVVQLLAGFSFLIIIHEFGHFIAARIFKLRVEKFYLFFDAFNIKFFKYNKNGCEYGIGWLPLGGYVKISGMVDESLDKEHLDQTPKKWEYRSRPAWQRLIVVSAGIIINFIAAILIFWLLVFFNGENVLPNKNVQGGILAGEIAQKIGFKTGDKIEFINGQPVKYFQDINDKSVLLGGAKVTVKRDNHYQDITIPDNFINTLADNKISPKDFITPRSPFTVVDIMPDSKAKEIGLAKGDIITGINGYPINYYDELNTILHKLGGSEATLHIKRNDTIIAQNTVIPKDGRLGIIIQMGLQYEHKNYGFFESLPIGIKKGFYIIGFNVNVVGKMIQGDINPGKVMSGPIGMAKVYGTEFNWINFLTLTAIISLTLAIMNFLPIPGLDGGHILFLIIEIIRGKPINEKILVNLQMVGMALLLLLMIYVSGNDIWKLIK